MSSFSLNPSGHVFTHSPVSIRLKYKHALQSVGSGSPVEVLLQPNGKTYYHDKRRCQNVLNQCFSCRFLPFQSVEFMQDSSQRILQAKLANIFSTYNV